MSALAFFLQGLVIGLAIAAPVGPIGLLCATRALLGGPVAGFVSGLGAASADAAYGAIAGFGLVAITDFLVAEQRLLRLVGGLFLLALGARFLILRPAESAAGPARGGHLGAYLGTFGLTLMNPATILSFAAVFAGLGLVGGDGYGDAAALVLGVFLGSAAWWLALSSAIGLFRARLTPAHMVWINRASGLVFAGFGALALASLI